jgi:hypothetical protein
VSRPEPAILALCLFALAGLPGVSAAAEARFGKGAWSVGANGGIAFLAMGDINDQIRIRNAVDLTRFEEIHHGSEWSADVRYGVAKKYFVGIESGGISAVSHDQAGTGELRVAGTPAVVLGGTTIDVSGAVAVRALAGLGALLNARFEEPGAGKVEGTGFLGYLGGEIEIRVAGALGLVGQGIVRGALLQHPENAPYDVDFSGGTFRGGLRATFGGER